MRRLAAILDRLAPLLAIVGLAGLTLLFLQQHTQQVKQNTFRVGQLRACHRLNVERARSNRNALAQFGSDKAILHYDLTFRSLIAASVKHETAQVRRNKRQRAETHKFIGKLSDEIDAERQSIDGVQWVKLTSCYPATDHPTIYSPPEPELFSSRPPPPAALTVGSGQ